MASHHTPMPLRAAPTRSVDEECGGPKAVRFDPDAMAFTAYRLHDFTALAGRLEATTLEAAQAEATERWHWDRGDRLGIREQGHEDSRLWPFDKEPVDRLHVYAIRRSAPIGWKLSRDGSRNEPVYRFKLDLICTVDLAVLGGAK